MKRKAKVTQDAVNNACNQLQADNKNVTVNAIINITGGSFSTVGAMVKHWKENQAAQNAPLPDLPDSLSATMHKAVAELWGTASTLTAKNIEHIQNETNETIKKTMNELSEYKEEVNRIENELEKVYEKFANSEKKLSDTEVRISTLSTQNATLQTRINDREEELKRLRADYEKLQTELITIAKEKTKKNY